VNSKEAAGSRQEAIELFDQSYGPFFTYFEFVCKCDACIVEQVGGVSDTEWFLTPEFKSFMSVLMALRIACGFPFTINSGYRCPDHNNMISSTGLDGPHTKGAADISVSFERAYTLNQLASAQNLGIGPVQKGKHSSRYMHIDNQGPRLWTY